jgi:hypothetical protein
MFMRGARRGTMEATGEMPTAYFRPWAFDAGALLLAVGVLATHHGVRAFRAAEATATWHDIDSPSSTGLTFTASGRSRPTGKSRGRQPACRIARADGEIGSARRTFAPRPYETARGHSHAWWGPGRAASNGRMWCVRSPRRITSASQARSASTQSGRHRRRPLAPCKAECRPVCQTGSRNGPIGRVF